MRFYFYSFYQYYCIYVFMYLLIIYLLIYLFIYSFNHYFLGEISYTATLVNPRWNKGDVCNQCGRPNEQLAILRSSSGPESPARDHREVNRN